MDYENEMNFVKYLEQKQQTIDKLHTKKKQIKTYYCGPIFFPRFLLRMLSKDFNLACEVHDQNYANQTISRREADRLFLRTMIKNNPTKKKQAYAFYYMVRIYGGFLYTVYKPKKNFKRTDVLQDHIDGDN